jgi:hypothetical protein
MSFIVYALLQSLWLRNLKPSLRAELALIGLARELDLGLVGCRASWASQLARAPSRALTFTFDFPPDAPSSISEEGVLWRLRLVPGGVAIASLESGSRTTFQAIRP